MSKKVFIASGAGFSGDRFDAAVPLVAHLSSCDGPRYLIFEVLAERTIALAQIAKSTDPDAGFSPYLDNYLRPILRQIKTHNIKIVSNMGRPTLWQQPVMSTDLLRNWTCHPSRLPYFRAMIYQPI